MKQEIRENNLKIISELSNDDLITMYSDIKKQVTMDMFDVIGFEVLQMLRDEMLKRMGGK